ncbi:membrane protein [Candidatus Thiomargarita nelsonii]|uniref:Membrane protein n=1 Tax=Candidatus Thiomargarita nelsonii TaxID=1003181 RepID=A0A176S574_9GAMM|nr:membrane protein [Candidatus Thiomargarita nelsonii]
MAATGTAGRRGCARRTASGGRRLTATASWGFGLPGCNACVLGFEPLAGVQGVSPCSIFFGVFYLYFIWLNSLGVQNLFWTSRCNYRDCL